MKSEGRSPKAEGSPNSEARVLVTFAVKEEAKPFTQLMGSQPQIRTLLTGIGPRNAERAIRAALAQQKPARVLTSGFAGGLRPDLAAQTVVFSADQDTGWEAALLAAGARPARFHCVERVATTVEQKRALWQATGADAVDMESQVIRALCREQQIPSATVRVILDAADTNLPLDFNQFLTADQQLDIPRLTRAVLMSPRKVPALLRLQQEGKAAAEKLGQLLARLLSKADSSRGPA
jgi:adenosylhomocysteine nucleosidase